MLNDFNLFQLSDHDENIYRGLYFTRASMLLQLLGYGWRVLSDNFLFQVRVLFAISWLPTNVEALSEESQKGLTDWLAATAAAAWWNSYVNGGQICEESRSHCAAECGLRATSRKNVINMPLDSGIPYIRPSIRMFLHLLRKALYLSSSAGSTTTAIQPPLLFLAAAPGLERYLISHQLLVLDVWNTIYLQFQLLCFIAPSWSRSNSTFTWSGLNWL